MHAPFTVIGSLSYSLQIASDGRWIISYTVVYNSVLVVVALQSHTYIILLECIPVQMNHKLVNFHF